MTITERISNSIKVLLHGAKALPFSALGGTYGFNGYSGGSLPGWGFSFQGSLPGSQYDDATAAGALWENPAAAACFVALTKAFAQARPYLEKRKTKDGNDWERVGHELIELIERPNPFYSGEKLFGVTLICAMSQGAAFWRIERDRRGMPAEIWYEPPVGIGASGISPDWDSENFISRYWYFVDGQRQTAPLPIEDVVYFRHGLNVANPRMPWSPLGLGSREIAVLNSASTYTAAVLRNYGAPAGFIGMEVGENGANPTPQQAEELKRHIEAKFGGAQNAGKTFVSPLPWKWNKVGMTPAEMVIDQIRQWPQETVCALLGTPVICALLPTGAQPTYQNLESSMKWWWDNTITPLEDSFADEIETQLFPAFDLDTNEYRISWDRSKVPALQDDEVATHTMWRADYQAGLIDRATFLDKIGEKPTPEDEGVYFGQPQNEQEQNVQELIRQGGVHRDAQKSVILEPLPESFYLKVIDRNGASHDELGRFDGGSGGSKGAFEDLYRWEGETPPEESKDFQAGKAQAVRKLLPFTKPASNEAAIIILKADGSEYDFSIGNKFSVTSIIPTNEDKPVAMLHTHPRPLSFSVVDYISFLTTKNIIQSHVITSDGAYSLQKPEDWKGTKDSDKDITDAYFNAMVEAFDQIEGTGMESSEQAEREIVMKIMADRYDILWRKGNAR